MAPKNTHYSLYVNIIAPSPSKITNKKIQIIIMRIDGRQIKQW